VSIRLVLACADRAIAEQFHTVVNETTNIELTDIVEDAGAIVDSIDRGESDVLVLHGSAGPVPVLELVREVALARPAVGVVLLVDDPPPETYAAAMESGARTVLTLPLAVEEVRDRVEAAAHWSRTVRSHLAGESIYGGGHRGRLVVVAGAKGGVGVTVLAATLAAQAQRSGQRTCLVDLDLQNGDVALYLGIDPRRSIVDLAEVADEITVRSLSEIAYRHSSGLTVLVAPEQGEQGEGVSARASRMMFSALRMQYELVIVDCGSTLTDATAVVTEVADTAILVTTPDVPALRAARRKLDMWERLQIRKPDDARVILNRASRRVEVQPDLAGRVLGRSLVATTVPAAFKELENAVNAGTLSAERGGTYQKAVTALGDELGVLSRPRRPSTRRGRRLAAVPASEAGQVLLETPVIVGLIVCCQCRAGGSAGGGRRRRCMQRGSQRIDIGMGAGALRCRCVQRRRRGLDSSHRSRSGCPGRHDRDQRHRGGSVRSPLRFSTRLDRGSMAVELVAVVPLLVMVTILCVEGFLAASAAAAAQKAARDAARAESLGRDGYAAAAASLPSWIAEESITRGGAAKPGCSGVCYRVSAGVPLVVPGFSNAVVTVSRTAELPG
jgi:pilus assembly protein CpaE